MTRRLRRGGEGMRDDHAGWLATNCIIPQWEAPPGVHALFTTRGGGFSQGVYASLNLGLHVGDDPAVVHRNRGVLRRCLPAEPRWLEQVHGNRVLDADLDEAAFVEAPPPADGVLSRRAGVVCGVMTADCLPVLLCDDAGTVVAAVHAGWRGLAEGVLETAVVAMAVEPRGIRAVLGPAIGPTAFEVGGEVRDRFIDADPAAAEAFVASRNDAKWMADLFALARRRLECAGVERVFGGQWCTHADPSRFFSYRRDGATGRMAALVWLEAKATRSGY